MTDGCMAVAGTFGGATDAGCREAIDRAVVPPRRLATFTTVQRAAPKSTGPGRAESIATDISVIT